MTKQLSNNNGQEFLVLKEFMKRRTTTSGSYTMWLIQFIETGTTMTIYKSNGERGKVKDPYYRECLGGGYSGIFEKVHYWKQARQLWRNMMKRCYNPKDKKGYFGKCFVDERWKGFENFLKDLPELDNFDNWLEGQNGGTEKYNLDKDLLSVGNKVYSKDLCMFVDEYTNKSDGARRARLHDKRYTGEYYCNKVDKV